MFIGKKGKDVYIAVDVCVSPVPGCLSVRGDKVLPTYLNIQTAKCHFPTTTAADAAVLTLLLLRLILPKAQGCNDRIPVMLVFIGLHSLSTLR